MIKLKTETDAHLVLSWISDISDQKTNKFLSQNGSIATIAQISGKKPENNAEKRRLARLSALTHIDYLKELLAKETINYISPLDPQWPNQLSDLGSYTPFGLFTKGDETLLLNESISIVGTRKSTVYGNTIAAEFAFDLATIGFNIVSGGATGIDTSSHHGALNAQGKTICVQANGLSKLYPSKNDFLFQKINNVGLIISEYPPGRNPVKNYFLDRNRIIAALSKSTIVVEAAEISGALSTARHALRMQRLVMAVPGSINSLTSEGTNALIRNREAESVANLEQILELVLPLGQIP
jgi:DNA processing protein